MNAAQTIQLEVRVRSDTTGAITETQQLHNGTNASFFSAIYLKFNNLSQMTHISPKLIKSLRCMPFSDKM